jgi:hypothetical protein
MTSTATATATSLAPSMHHASMTNNNHHIRSLDCSEDDIDSHIHNHTDTDTDTAPSLCNNSISSYCSTSNSMDSAFASASVSTSTHTYNSNPTSTTATTFSSFYQQCGIPYQHLIQPAKQTIPSSSSSLNSTIQLNVGGVMYCTTLNTLTRIPQTFFTSLLSVEWQSQGGNVSLQQFIDRDGILFAHILNYMRDGILTFIEYTHDLQFLHQLSCEADFYSLTQLSHTLRNRIDDIIDQQRTREYQQQQMIQSAAASAFNTPCKAHAHSSPNTFIGKYDNHPSIPSRTVVDSRRNLFAAYVNEDHDNDNAMSRNTSTDENSEMQPMNNSRSQRDYVFTLDADF